MHEAKVTQKLYPDKPSRDRNFETDDEDQSFRRRRGGIQIRSPIGPLSYQVNIEVHLERKNADHMRSPSSIVNVTLVKRDTILKLDDISSTEVPEISKGIITCYF
ncbi:hypothetical protein RF11_05730 [Thelohanellus kitauei]|uniref:Uncharacterized protein n=1 Tax=Thelohanellus kitauei TaxID=669202 RepID=A0A0C2IYA8_THEKT|nr:hypothetical protein RF11_05730 [Thelohanellus kitauei]